MGNSLAEMDDWIKDLAFSKRIQSFSVVCLATLVDLDSPRDKKTGKMVGQRPGPHASDRIYKAG